MVYLAETDPNDFPVPKQNISKAEGITPDYVEQILSKLRTAGLVRSHRGKRGGFSLAKDPREITVLDILVATEGDLSLVSCENLTCEQSKTCVTKNIWKEAATVMQTMFAKKNIADLAKEAREIKSAVTVSYTI
jgi:Rrf2 family protein